MELDRVIRGRRSIRAYKPEPVPEGTIREILDAARWAPSWRNTQAWNVWVLTGDALQRYKDERSKPPPSARIPQGSTCRRLPSGRRPARPGPPRS